MSGSRRGIRVLILRGLSMNSSHKQFLTGLLLVFFGLVASVATSEGAHFSLPASYDSDSLMFIRYAGAGAIIVGIILGFLGIFRMK